VSFPGGKSRQRRDAEHSLHLVLMSRMSRSYTSSHIWRLDGVVGQLYITFTIYKINSVSYIIMPPPYFVAAAVDTWLLTLVLT
jgi:hypothetical protein